MPKGCGCGGNSQPAAVRWKWVGADGRTATNLTEAKAKEKAIRMGGTASPM